MNNSIKNALLGAIAAVGLAGSAQSAVIDLTFEGITETYGEQSTAVGGFYNGGVSGDSTSGTNYGVGFSDNALAVCLNSTSVFCSNGSRGGQGDPNSQQGALFFLEGSQTFMNVAAGFTTGFSFFYSAVNQAGSVSVYDGLNGAGNLLATLAIPTTSSGTCSAYGAGFCPFFASGIAFAGTAMSVSFAGVANQIAFDDVTFGSVNPGPSPVPLPAGLPLLAAAIGAVALVKRRKA